MLWIEGASVCLIAVIVAVIVLWPARPPPRPQAQVHLTGSTPIGLRLGVMLAIFSFVGFESATTLGAEAKDPLTTIPQAVIRSAVFSGIFFIVCAYTLVSRLPRACPIPLNESAAPLPYPRHPGPTSPRSAGSSIVGVLVSMFAATLSCIIAGARVLMLMAHHGFVPRASAGPTPPTTPPAPPVSLTGFLAFIPAAILAHRGVSGNDIYGYMGSTRRLRFPHLPTASSPPHSPSTSNAGASLTEAGSLSRHRRSAAMILAHAVGTIYPIPPAPYRYLPYVYLAYLICRSQPGTAPCTKNPPSPNPAILSPAFIPPGLR